MARRRAKPEEEKTIPEMADELTRIIIVCNVGRILRKDISHYLVYWVIALYHEGIINRIEDLLHLGLRVNRSKFPGRIFQASSLPNLFL